MIFSFIGLFQIIRYIDSKFNLVFEKLTGRKCER
jgi:hypothetical protein